MKKILHFILIVLMSTQMNTIYAQTNSIIQLEAPKSEPEYLTKEEFFNYSKNIRKGGRMIGIGGGLLLTTTLFYTFGFTQLGTYHSSGVGVTMVILGSISGFTSFALITAGGIKISKSPILKNRKETAQIHYQFSPTQAGLSLKF